MKRILIAGILLSIGTVYAQQNISLKECIAYGLQHHRAVKIAENNIAKSKEQGREALSSYLPQVNVTGEYDYNMKLPTTIIPAGVFGTEPTKMSMGSRYSSTLVGQLDQPVYNQSLLLGIRANEPNMQLAQLGKVQTNEQLIYNIASSYYQVLVIQKHLQLLQSNKSRTEKLLEVMKLQAQQGVAKKINAKQVEVNLNNINSQISNAENNYTLALNSLKGATGMDLNSMVALSDTARWLQTEQLLPISSDFNYANTTSYKIQEKQLELYDINAQSIKAGYLPTVSLFGRYGFNGFGQKGGEVFSNQFDYSVVGVKLSIPIFDGFRKNAQYKQAKISISNAQENLKLNEISQNLAFINADSRREQARVTLSSDKKNMSMAQELYENVSLQYKQGTSSLSDLLNAETSWSSAQNNYIQSLINYYIANLNVANAQGKLQEFYTNL